MSNPSPLDSGPVSLASQDFNTMPVRPPSPPPSTSGMASGLPPQPPPSAPPGGRPSAAPSTAVMATGGASSARGPWLVTALAVVLGVTAAFLLWTRGEEQATAARDAEGKLQKAIDDADARGRDASALTAKVERLERENAELLVLKQELADDVDRLKQATAALEEKMKAEIDAGDVAVVNDNGRLRVDLIDKIVFDSGDALVSKRGEEVLARVGAVLASVDGKIIQVAGHTDDSPPTGKVKEQFPTNWELSVARATNVVRFLEEKSKLKGARLVASGHGQFSPVATNANPRGRARNRRIEILLVPALAPTATAKTASK